MNYYFVNTLGEVDGERAVVDRPPDKIGLKSYKPAQGLRVGKDYKADQRMTISKKFGGVKLESLLGNTLSYLIVKHDVRDVIEEYCANAEVEYLPFTLYNLKKRVHSGDYVIVNPIGTIDCLNLKASDITYLDAPGDVSHGEVVSVDEFVLDPAKLTKAPALFRIKEAPRKYVVNEELADAFKSKRFTNIELTEIEQKRSKGR